jgi:hypothetical protein
MLLVRQEGMSDEGHSVRAENSHGVGPFTGMIFKIRTSLTLDLRANNVSLASG